MKKIKIFLGGYINFINAQNLNCRALADHLDKNRFDVYALLLYSGTLDTNKFDETHLFKCRYPHKIFKYLGYFWGILNCDVAYLPKGEICNWNKFWIKLLGRKSLRTVEGIYGKEMLGEILSNKNITYKEFKKSFEGYDKLFSITRFVKNYNEKHHNIKCEEKILYLGADIDIFLNVNKAIESLKNIIFIGRLKRRKGVFDILEIAKSFPELNFYMAGNGEDEEEIKRDIASNKMKNVELLGTLTHEELASKLKSMDLHLFPSRSEGFPKVTLETAAAGVPSLVYDDYGADGWITHGKNGYVVHTIEEIKETIKHLKDNPKELQEVSKNAIEMAKRFDWRVVIKEWERVIEELYNEKKI